MLGSCARLRSLWPHWNVNTHSPVWPHLRPPLYHILGWRPGYIGVFEAPQGEGPLRSSRVLRQCRWLPGTASLRAESNDPNSVRNSHAATSIGPPEIRDGKHCPEVAWCCLSGCVQARSLVYHRLGDQTVDGIIGLCFGVVSSLAIAFMIPPSSANCILEA
jgi:hypothetical protein